MSDGMTSIPADSPSPSTSAAEDSAAANPPPSDPATANPAAGEATSAAPAPSDSSDPSVARPATAAEAPASTTAGSPSAESTATPSTDANAAPDKAAAASPASPSPASADSGKGGTADKAGEEPKAQDKWLGVKERGSILGIRFVIFLVTFLGRLPARVFIAFLTVWYFLFDARARRASREALRRMTGAEPTNGQVFRHILTFARVSLDRLFFATGKTHHFDVDFHGEEFMRDLRTAKKGAILLMAHVGSFECGRALASQRAFAINVVGNFHNSAMINAALESLNPNANTRVIDAAGSIDFIFRIQQAIARGELVAIMADRVGADGKKAEVDFMGGKADFPTGPYQLAALLGCPVYFACGIYTEPNRYDLYCEPFADKLRINRKDREGSLKPWMAKYAELLAKYALKAPYNWFNFYDYWTK